jgi:predicted adenylyl cyclase CyaB
MTSGRANVEIKARLRDLEAARRVALGLCARFEWEDRQVDTYFRVPRGRLKLRESSLSGAEVIIYVRPDAAGPRRSDYAIIPAGDPVRLRWLLEQMLGVEAVVEKTRRLFVLGETRIHLDSVRGLGDYLELEAVHDAADPAAEAAARREVERLTAAFGFRDDELVAGSYRELILASGR